MRIVEKALMADATIPLKRMIFRGHIHNAAVIVPLGIDKLYTKAGVKAKLPFHEEVITGNKHLIIIHAHHKEGIIVLNGRVTVAACSL